ncbi:MAG: GvpL/GvpF family gas vesicle protein [Deltaproteobacteria bacterium]|nr:GvpL/GvpF family gas vesicle protein [Deltaproteobacteria bacterium]
MDISQVLRDPKGLTHGTKVASPREERFIYCFTERGEEAYPFTGLEGAKVEAISYGEIAAVVSPYKTTGFDQLEKWAQRKSILKHQEVNGHIFSTRTVVPVRFGTIAGDPLQVKELLKKIYLQVKAALKRLEGKIELAVRASWDLNTVLQELKGEMMIEKAGVTDLQEKIAIGKRLFEVVNKRKRDIINTIHHGLYPLAADFSVGREGTEEMIVDRSYLVEREKEPLLDEVLNRLTNEYEERLTFKCIGPLPPYSFTRLEIAQGNFEVVDEARKALGLAERSSLEEIKASYRRLSLMHHPDRNPADPGAEERFRNVAQAYEILEAYCENNRWLEKGRIYPFAREDVESSVMVRNRGVK